MAQIMSFSGSLHSYSNKLEHLNWSCFSEYCQFYLTLTISDMPLTWYHLCPLFENNMCAPLLAYLPFVGCWSTLKSVQCATFSTPSDPFVNKELFISRVLFTVAPLIHKLQKLKSFRILSNMYVGCAFWTNSLHFCVNFYLHCIEQNQNQTITVSLNASNQPKQNIVNTNQTQTRPKSTHTKANKYL